MTTIRLIGPSQRDFAKRQIDAAPDGWVCKIGEETRSDKQNRALHGWVTILRQALPDTFGQFDMEDCKLRLMNALKSEMKMLPALEGAGFFPVGQRTSTLSRTQFAALQTVVLEYAARHGVDLPVRDELEE